MIFAGLPHPRESTKVIFSFDSYFLSVDNLFSFVDVEIAFFRLINLNTL